MAAVEAFAAIGDTVMVRTGDGSCAAVVAGQVRRFPRLTPEQWLRNNGGYAVDPSPAQAAAAVAAVKGST